MTTVNPVLDKVRQRLWRHNKNWMAAIYGETGSGKSYTSLNVAAYIDRRFTIDNVFFSCKDFIRAINDGSLKKGSVSVLDEAGIAFSNRAWMKTENKQMSFLLQSFRHLNLGLVLTLPSISFLDVAARKLLHVLMRTVTINRIKGQCYVKYYNVRWNDDFKDFTRKFPFVLKPDGRYMQVDHIRFGKPSKQLLRVYERRKKKYLAALNIDIEAKIAGENQPKQPKAPSKKQLIIQDLKDGLTTKEIARKHETSVEYVRNTKSNA